MDYIEIEGYKSIKKARIELKPINILIGANGSGKSNFLSFFEFLNKLYEQKLTEYVNISGGTEKFLFGGIKIADKISSKIGLKLNAYSFILQNGLNGFIFVHEGLWYQHNPFLQNPIEISFGGTEAQVKNSSIERAYHIKKYLDSIKKYHFHDTGLNSPFSKSSNVENDIYFLYEKGDNLAAFLYNLQEKYFLNYKRIVKIIQSIAPYFSDFFLRPNDNNLIRLQWQDKFNSTVYGVNDLSDGTIRFIALTVLFMQPNLPACIVIDEPELGLHPFANAKLAGMIKSAASKNCQIIVATQSTELISHFEPENIITVDQIDGESRFNRLNSESLAKWLEDYTIDDLWKRSIIKGGHPN